MEEEQNFVNHLVECFDAINAVLHSQGETLDEHNMMLELDGQINDLTSAILELHQKTIEDLIGRIQVLEAEHADR